MSALYDQAYARRYRDHDDSLDDSVPYLDLAGWIQSVCQRFEPGIDALDLGCGTGRYFSVLRGVRRLVGIDASSDMLAEAAHPIHADEISVKDIALVCGDLSTYAFPPQSFDLVYSIGVLAEHVPLDADLVTRVRAWLRPGGRFAFTTVHPDSHSVPRTWKRQLARAARGWLPAPLEVRVRERLLSGGLYADEDRVQGLLAGGFAVETLERFVSEAHLHCRCVARVRG